MNSKLSAETKLEIEPGIYKLKKKWNWIYPSNQSLIFTTPKQTKLKNL